MKEEAQLDIGETYKMMAGICKDEKVNELDL